MTLSLLLLLAVGFVSVKFILPLQKSAEKNGPDTAPRDFALQTDAALALPDPQPALAQKVPNPQGNLYWGELHVHTAESFDARLFGTTLTIEDAYRFAKGEPLENVSGEVMQLTRPLDFVAITDHGRRFWYGHPLRRRRADHQRANGVLVGFRTQPTNLSNPD